MDNKNRFTIISLMFAACVGVFGIALIGNYGDNNQEISRSIVREIGSDEFQVNLIRVVDGDTVDVEFHIWIDIILRKRIRLYGIDTPEVIGAEKEEGVVVRDYLVDRLEGKEIYLSVQKPTEKFGRVVGTIFIKEDGILVNINEELVEKGFAKEYYP